MTQTTKFNAPLWASYTLAVLALLLVLKAGLLAALFSGLLVYSLIHLLAPTIEKKFSGQRARMIAVIFLSVLIVTAITLMIWALYAYLRSDGGNVHVLLQKLADIIEASRNQMPEWVSANLPGDVDDLREMLSSSLREHAGEAKILGQEAFHVIVHLLLGMVIGSMVALQDTIEQANYRPFAAALHQRVANLGLMFQKIVFAQVRISLINTVFTAIYLMIVLPLAGIHLPLTKSMIAITFIAGLIPVVGNIVSNAVIVIVGLSHSLNTAGASLVFMIVIHKLEYFLNARIIGAQVNARSWELLTAILVMETVFGLPGVVAAPVFYAYLKKELTDQGLV
ncbi:AI-2E family transporter [Undibacterium sp. Xuan67W]|uniref:AI-2E family transporter n=1 Tax=Undibacterium sp. Xuan67W TaxID=3413057 RepID=UPI003BF0709D